MLLPAASDVAPGATAACQAYDMPGTVRGFQPSLAPTCQLHLSSGPENTHTKLCSSSSSSNRLMDPEPEGKGRQDLRATLSLARHSLRGACCQLGGVLLEQHFNNPAHRTQPLKSDCLH
jgi:hypothetical protein